MFHVHRDEWEWIERFQMQRGKSPSKAAFRAKFPKFTLVVVDDVEHFTDEVRESHARHVVTELIYDSVAELKAGELATKIATSLYNELMILETQVCSSVSSSEVVGDWQDTYDEVVRRYNRASTKGTAGVPTGFPTLDNLTGGASPGDYWVIAARLGQGKTWTMVRMACASVYAGLSVNYHALEQTRTQIHMRCHSFMSSKLGGQETFKALDLMKGQNFNLLDYKKFLRGLGNNFSGKLHVSDTSRGYVTPATIAAQIELHHPDVVFIDYLTLMDHGDDWRSTANLSGEIKSLAQRYQVPIIVAAQINRSGVGREPPGPEHLSSSDSIGQDADCVVTMKQMSKRVVKMRLAKFRHGRDNEQWWCEFRPNTGQYEEVSGDTAQTIIDEDSEEDD